MIHYLQHNKIDQNLWNACISKCKNASPTLYYDYLNIICKNQWEAVVYLDERNDYIAVLPLPYKYKYFIIKHFYQPPYIQKLGLYTYLENFDTQAQAMWNNAFRNILYFHFQISALHKPTSDKILFTERINYVLDIDRSYDDIFQKYSSMQKKKLISFQKKKESLAVKEIEADAAFDFIKNNNKYTELRSQYQEIEHLILKYISSGHGTSWQLSQGDTTLAVLIVLEDAQRAVNLINVSSADGYKVDAMAVLIDFYIQKNAGMKNYFDFEGSMIEGVARFFKTFSPEEEVYYKIKKR